LAWDPRKGASATGSSASHSLGGGSLVARLRRDCSFAPCPPRSRVLDVGLRRRGPRRAPGRARSSTAVGRRSERACAAQADPRGGSEDASSIGRFDAVCSVMALHHSDLERVVAGDRPTCSGPGGRLFRLRVLLGGLRRGVRRRGSAPTADPGRVEAWAGPSTATSTPARWFRPALGAAFETLSLDCAPRTWRAMVGRAPPSNARSSA